MVEHLVKSTHDGVQGSRFNSLVPTFREKAIHVVKQYSLLGSLRMGEWGFCLEQCGWGTPIRVTSLNEIRWNPIDLIDLKFDLNKNGNHWSFCLFVCTFT